MSTLSALFEIKASVGLRLIIDVGQYLQAKRSYIELDKKLIISFYLYQNSVMASGTVCKYKWCNSNVGDCIVIRMVLTSMLNNLML